MCGGGAVEVHTRSVAMFLCVDQGCVCVCVCVCGGGHGRGVAMFLCADQGSVCVCVWGGGGSWKRCSYVPVC